MKGKGVVVPARSVDEYLSSLPDKPRKSLQKLRRTIRKVAPEATEQISYQMPIFFHYGMLVGFAAFREHCSFFLMSKRLMSKYQSQLKSYSTSAGTIRFLPEKPLPDALVKKMVKARVKENEEKRKKKKLAPRT